MRNSRFTIPEKEITAFCKRWNITEFSLFGSALRADFRADSDVDVLVTIHPDAHIGLLDIAQMQIELEAIFKRPVDIVEKEGLRNPYRKREILKTAKVVYAA
jgi:predicted nucleotidyltransferase